MVTQLKNVAMLLLSKGIDFRKVGETFEFTYNNNKMVIEVGLFEYDVNANEYIVTIKQWDSSVFTTKLPSKIEVITHYKHISSEVIAHTMQTKFNS